MKTIQRRLLSLSLCAALLVCLFAGLSLPQKAYAEDFDTNYGFVAKNDSSKIILNEESVWLTGKAATTGDLFDYTYKTPVDPYNFEMKYTVVSDTTRDNGAHSRFDLYILPSADAALSEGVKIQFIQHALGADTEEIKHTLIVGSGPDGGWDNYAKFTEDYSVDLKLFSRGGIFFLSVNGTEYKFSGNSAALLQTMTEKGYAFLRMTSHFQENGESTYGGNYAINEIDGVKFGSNNGTQEDTSTSITAVPEYDVYTLSGGETGGVGAWINDVNGYQAVIFATTTEFYGFSLPVSWAGEATVKAEVFAYQDDAAASMAGTALFSQTDSYVGDGKTTIYKFDGPLPAGGYLIKFTKVDGASHFVLPNIAPALGAEYVKYDASANSKPFNLRLFLSAPANSGEYLAKTVGKGYLSGGRATEATAHDLKESGKLALLISVPEGQHLKAIIGEYSPTWGNNGDGFDATAKVYVWKDNYEDTLAEDAIASALITEHNDNANAVFTFDKTVSSGKYLVEFSASSISFGFWSADGPGLILKSFINGTESSYYPTTYFVTGRGEGEVPAEEPVTEPVTDPVTDPVTEPVTDPKTEPNQQTGDAAVLPLALTALAAICAGVIVIRRRKA